MTRIVVSLTSIPPRFAGLQDCLRALLLQTAQIDEIALYLPPNYRRFPGAVAPPQVPAGVTLKPADKDYGPATKVLPAVAEYAGTDTLILFGDDDKVYCPNWAQNLIDCAKEHPDSCVTAVGSRLSEFSAGPWAPPRAPAARFVQKDWKYRAKRAASFGRWKPERVQGAGHVDLLCGWGGCAVRPDFFGQEAFDIPDILWTVDDIWLSGCLERHGVPIWLEPPDTSSIPQRGANDTNDHALRSLTYKQHNRAAANEACIRYFRQRYGIWGGEIAKPPSRDHVLQARQDFVRLRRNK